LTGTRSGSISQTAPTTAAVRRTIAERRLIDINGIEIVHDGWLYIDRLAISASVFVVRPLGGILRIQTARFDF
jgi:hypothetical protein